MKIKFDFTGTTVAITGASGGIAKGAALEFAKAGANLVIGDIKDAEGKQCVKEIKELGAKAIFVKTDVTSPEDTKKFFEKAIEEFGEIDILVNGAGTVSRFIGMPLTLTDNKDFDLTYKVNLMGIYNTVKASYDYFVDRKQGKIINLTSVVGHSTNPGIPHYAASKAAAINLTLTLAKELGPSNIKVNTVCPGYVYTPMYENATPQIKKVHPSLKDMTGKEIVEHFAKSNCALQRSQTVEDVAQAVLYLASSAGENITGIVLDVAGGYKL